MPAPDQGGGGGGGSVAPQKDKKRPQQRRRRCKTRILATLLLYNKFKKWSTQRRDLGGETKLRSKPVGANIFQKEEGAMSSLPPPGRTAKGQILENQTPDEINEGKRRSEEIKLIPLGGRWTTCLP